MANSRPNNTPIIKNNLKTSDRIRLIYNNEEIEMSILDFNSFLTRNVNGFVLTAGDEITGNLKISAQGYSELTDAVEPTGTTQSINWDDGNSQVIDLDSATGSVTLTLTNPKPGATYLLKVIQGDTTARDFVYPSNVKFPGGVAPVITAMLGAEDLIVFFYDGTNYLTSFNQNYQ